MTAATFNLVLLAALIHAGWSAIVKGSRNKLLTTVLIALSAAAASALALPFLPAPARASWPFLLTSTALQTGYFLLVAATYRVADMSLAYPLMRGTAPLIVALFSVLVLGEVLAPLAWAGIGVICAGILALALAATARVGPGVLLALATALVIASYTLIDGTGARLSGAPVAYTLWLNLLTGLPFALWLLLRRPAGFGHYLRQNWAYGLTGGLGTLISYGLALYAMTAAPIATVAALRETSILFGVAIAALVLKEPVGRPRIMAAMLVLAGAVLIRLG